MIKPCDKCGHVNHEKSVIEHIRDYINHNHNPPGYDELVKTEWSPEFEQGMRNRLLFGALRYGRLDRPNVNDYPFADYAKQRIALYLETGNMEYLLDCANMCLYEFERGIHPKRHFKSTDDGVHFETT